MTEPASRHDHFPRADAARLQRMRVAAADLDARWRAADALPGGLLAAIEAAAGGPTRRAVEALMPFLADTGWLCDRLAAATALLAAEPFARPPLRMLGGGDGAGGLLLAERGPVRLSLQLHRFDGRAVAPATALFVPGRAAIRILAAGGAQIGLHRVEVGADEETGRFTAAAAADCRSDPPRPLVAGEILMLDTGREAFTLAGMSGDVLLLELTIQPPSPLPIRAYDLASGRLAHVSASRRDSSFRSMALTLLRAFGRTDAAPLFVAETESEDFAARWSAMRELVALDAASARPRLARMAAQDPHPEIRRAAAATLALLAPLEAEPCPV